MAYDAVPWMIGNDLAKHSAELGRVVSWASLKGRRGVIRSGDMKVLALAVPGAGVRISPGAVAIPNEIGGASGQSYIARVSSDEIVNVSATGAASGLTRYVIWRINDPQYGGQTPADPVNGLYNWPELVTSLNGITYPYERLATIVQPANTATITQAMITDNRKIAMPQTWPEQRVYALTSGQSSVLDHTGAYPDSGETWPVETEAAWGEIPIPEWATHAQIKMEWSGVKSPPGNAWGWVWVQVAPTLNVNNFKTQAVMYDTADSGSNNRIHIMVADEQPIPAALRGTSQKFYPRGNVLSAAAGSHIRLDPGSVLSLDVLFKEKAQ